MPPISDPRPKRLQVTATDGWTHILKGSKNYKNRQHLLVESHLRPLQPSEVPEGLNLETVRERYKTYGRLWKGSECYKSLKSILHRDLLDAEQVKVTQCICLGLGSFTGGKTWKASWYQLVALVSILEILGAHKMEHVYLQDPTFNDLDTEFLGELGYTILKTPDALNKMTSTTFLFAPHLETVVVAEALECASPSVYIGNILEDWIIDHGEESMATKETFQQFLDSSASVVMPEFDQHTWYLFTRIYWRLQADR